MLATNVTYFSRKVLCVCDAKCHKAWGVNCRPKIQLSDDPDDYVYLADDELGDAPIDPGTYEGSHGKPTGVPKRHNKWCTRQCERSALLTYNPREMPSNFNTRVFNQPVKHL